MNMQMKLFFPILMICSSSLLAQELRRNVGDNVAIPIQVTGRIIPDCALSDSYIDLGAIELSVINTAGSVSPLVQSEKPLSINCDGDDGHAKFSIQFNGEVDNNGNWTVRKDNDSARGVGVQLFYYQNASEPLLIDNKTTLFSGDFDRIGGKYFMPIAARVVSDGHAIAGNITSTITMAFRIE